ncbi:MAG: hypothetical protein PVG07_11695, partial [Acidobacteriota bacterium]
FNAFQTGVPLADFLSRGMGEDTLQRKIKIIAHSAGNIVVNSAISLLSDEDLSPIEKYVMYDAALPAEAFEAGYSYGDDEREALIVPATEELGYPDDARWEIEWEESIRFTPLRFLWDYRIGRNNKNLEPQPDYTQRWTQKVGFEPRVLRGPWLGRFSENVERVSMVNVFNKGDGVLGLGRSFVGLRLSLRFLRVRPWQAAQRLLKPYLGPLGLRRTSFPDGPVSQFWARLKDTEKRKEDYLWRVAGGNTELFGSDLSDRAELTRGWAELAYWFPSLSEAAGTTQIQGVQSIDLSDVGQAGLLESHSFLVAKEFVEVWSGFEEIVDALE